MGALFFLSNASLCFHTGRFFQSLPIKTGFSFLIDTLQKTVPSSQNDKGHLAHVPDRMDSSFDFHSFPFHTSRCHCSQSRLFLFLLIPVINSICFRSFPFFFRAAGMYILLLPFPASGRAIPGGALFVESKTKTPSRNISIPGRGSYITFIKIPRYHPHWKASAFILSSVLRHTPENTSIQISAHSPTLARNGGCRTALLPALRSLLLPVQTDLLPSVPKIFSSQGRSQSVTSYSCRPLKIRVLFFAFTYSIIPLYARNISINFFLIARLFPGPDCFRKYFCSPPVWAVIFLAHCRCPLSGSVMGEHLRFFRGRLTQKKGTGVDFYGTFVHTT